MSRLTKHVCFHLAVAASLLAVCSAANAQCSTCPAPTVAYYQPAMQTVAYQPTVTYQERSGWYLGRMFDRWRLRRWNRRAATAAYTASYTPYAAGYAPASAPYVTGYAPMQRLVTQTSYQPVTAVGACSGCAQTTYRPVVTQSYAPATVYRPVVMQPVVAASPVIQASCATCVSASPCSSCEGASSVVGTPVYSTPGEGCSSCGDAPTVAYPAPSESTLSPGAESSNGVYGPTTPQPTLKPEVAEPAQPTYGGNGVGGGSPTLESGSPDPASSPNGATDTSTFFQAPPLLDSGNADRSASKPSVNVWTAVYHKPVRSTSASVAATKSTSRDAEPTFTQSGWYSVPRSQ